jgi:hypothetical protein
MDLPTAQPWMRRLDIFGHLFLVAREGAGWGLYYPGGEGKRGPRLALPIPHFVRTEAELAAYLADLCHEWATPAQPDVRWVD